MKVVFCNLHTGETFVLPLDRVPDAYMGHRDLEAGYRLPLDGAYSQQIARFIEQESAEERLLCCMYEGGEFSGLWMPLFAPDASPYAWSWALLPESVIDIEHLETIIIPYGRKGIREPNNPVAK